MVRRSITFAAGLLLAGVLGLAGCQDDQTVEPSRATFEGAYEGSYRFLQIVGEADTTADQSYGVEVTFRDTTFLMHFTGDVNEFQVYCDRSGVIEVARQEATVTVTTTSDLNYTRGICDTTFGKGGTFSYQVVSNSLRLVEETASSDDQGHSVRLIKKLGLRRSD